MENETLYAIRTAEGLFVKAPATGGNGGINTNFSVTENPKDAARLTQAQADELLKKCPKKLLGAEKSAVDAETGEIAAPTMCRIVLPKKGRYVKKPENTGKSLLASGIELTPDKGEAALVTFSEAQKVIKQCPTKLCGAVPEPTEGPGAWPTCKTPRRSFSQAERRSVYKKDEGHCWICGEFIMPDEMAIDHVMPISKGGTYVMDNLRCCCKRCNTMKADALPDDFLDLVGDVMEYQVESGSTRYDGQIRKMAEKIASKTALYKEETPAAQGNAVPDAAQEGPKEATKEVPNALPAQADDDGAFTPAAEWEEGERGKKKKRKKKKGKDKLGKKKKEKKKAG